MKKTLLALIVFAKLFCSDSESDLSDLETAHIIKKNAPAQIVMNDSPKKNPCCSSLLSCMQKDPNAHPAQLSECEKQCPLCAGCTKNDAKFAAKIAVGCTGTIVVCVGGAWICASTIDKWGPLCPTLLIP